MTVGNTTARWRNVVTLVSAGVAVGLGVPALAAPPTYHLVDLGTLGGVNSSGTGINAGGKVSGNDNNQGTAFRSSGKTPPITLTNLGNVGGNTTQSTGINNGGQVVGSGTINTSGQILTHAFRTTGGTIEDLGPNSFSQSYGERYQRQRRHRRDRRGRHQLWACLSTHPGCRRDARTRHGRDAERERPGRSGNAPPPPQEVVARFAQFRWDRNPV